MRRALLLAALALAGCGGSDKAPVPTPEQAPEPPETVVPFGAAVAADPARDDEAYRAAFARTFSVLVLENSTTWAVVQPEPGKYDFAQTDALVDLARSTGKRVRGMLVWDQVLPVWLTDDPPAPKEVRRIMVDHIRTLVERYRGRVQEWVVVNEPLDDAGDGLEPSIWLRAMGERYIDIAFAAARRADPAAKLLLNEIAAERGHKLDALVTLARRLRARGVPFDAVGLQNHTTARDFPSRAELRGALDRFAALGLDAEITEMDVVLGDASLQRQAAAYRAGAQACRRAERCTGFTVWGVTDRHSWKGEEAHALLFTDDGKPKPAARAVLDALRAP